MNALNFNFADGVARMELSSQGNGSVRKLASYCNSLVQGFLFPYRESLIVSCLLFRDHTGSGDRNESGQTDGHPVQSRLLTL